MILVPRPLLALAALGLLGLAALTWPGMFAALGIDSRQVPGNNDPLDRALARSDRLDAGLVEARRRTAARHKLLRDLAAGRISVPEAARQFWEVRAAPAAYLRSILQEERGDSDEERLCRHVIRWIREELEDSPAEAERAVAQRERELAEHLARHGRVVLPGGELTDSGDDLGR